LFTNFYFLGIYVPWIIIIIVIVIIIVTVIVIIIIMMRRTFVGHTVLVDTTESELSLSPF